MNPNEGLFRADHAREAQAQGGPASETEPSAASSQTPFDPAAGLFRASAELECIGLPDARTSALMRTVDEQKRQRARLLSQNRRPWPVTLISLYKFINTVVIVVPLVLLIIWPNAPWKSNVLIHLIFNRTRDSSTPMLLLPGIFAAYNMVVAWGLWVTLNWARNVVMGGAGVALLFGVRYLVVTSVWFGTWHFPGSELVYLSMVCELTIFLTMKMYPDVRDVFRVGEHEN